MLYIVDQDNQGKKPVSGVWEANIVCLSEK